jgi:proline iminopeptidase
MNDLYPAIEPYDRGLLETGDGNRVYWECCGNPRGKPAVVLHGGPGSGCTPWHRRLFDPEVYRIVLFDQRNCGRSTPHASTPDIDLTSNHTQNLIGDIERIREHLAIERWLALGGSWGSTLALAYAQAHSSRVSELTLFGVTTGRRKEFDWYFRGGVSVLFPEQWERLWQAVPPGLRDGDIIEAYHHMLHDRDASVRELAALAWCRWESATPAWPPRDGLSPRFSDPAYRLAFSRIVVHYVRNYGFLEDGVLLRNANVIAEMPAIMVSGRFDLQAPIAWAYDLKRAWPRAELVIVDKAGHDASAIGITRELIAATNRFARRA